MTYIIDIDGTICTQSKDGSYTDSIPHISRIEQINTLYDEGHNIIYWTGRGSNRNIDFEEHTKKQLEQWKCKFHELRMKKPVYDVWIDDKAKWIF